MQVSITDPVHQTILFAIFFGIIFLLTFRKKQGYTSFSLTQELKGFAILAIVFAHIGYYLSSDSRFLFPFSILAGVGVNFFFLLSGYGLSLSKLRKNESIRSFYKRRLLKLFVPLWIVLVILTVLDFFVHGLVYQKIYLLKAIFGIFTNADLYHDIDSPLWYFTLILIYYILFPLFFSKKRLWLTALFLYAAIWVLVKINIPFFYGVIGLYKVHMLAFPLGVAAAWIVSTYREKLLLLKKTFLRHGMYVYLPSALVLLVLAAYFSIHSNVGGAAYMEDLTSMFVVLLILLLFIIKKRESQLFSIIGLYSYEIYLLHWPLVYRYDILFKHTPASVAMVLYIGVFILLAMLLQKSTQLFSLKQKRSLLSTPEVAK